MTDQTNIDALVKEINKHCVGHLYAKIAWPHRLLHKTRAALETLSERCRELETRCAEAYQAVGMLAEALDANDDENIIRLQDVLAYGKTTDGKELLPFPLLTPPKLAAYDAAVEKIERYSFPAANGHSKCVSNEHFDALLACKDGK